MLAMCHEGKPAKPQQQRHAPEASFHLTQNSFIAGRIKLSPNDRVGEAINE
jgi:hypothetical protein